MSQKVNTSFIIIKLFNVASIKNKKINKKNEDKKHLETCNIYYTLLEAKCSFFFGGGGWGIISSIYIYIYIYIYAHARAGVQELASDF